ncbi:MAG: metal-dependent hydrolase [Anaerolineae bacterium]
MTGVVHALIGSAAASALGLENSLEVAGAIVGSLVPDIDEPGSTVGRLVPGSSIGRAGRVIVGGVLCWLGISRGVVWMLVVGLVACLTGFLRHRGMTHSIVGLAAVGLLIRALALPVWRGFLLGYALHLIADACTPQGIPVAWPCRRRFRLTKAFTGGLR